MFLDYNHYLYNYLHSSIVISLHFLIYNTLILTFKSTLIEKANLNQEYLLLIRNIKSRLV